MEQVEQRVDKSPEYAAFIVLELKLLSLWSELHYADYLPLAFVFVTFCIQSNILELTCVVGLPTLLHCLRYDLMAFYNF